MFAISWGISLLAIKSLVLSALISGFSTGTNWGTITIKRKIPIKSFKYNKKYLIKLIVIWNKFKLNCKILQLSYATVLFPFHGLKINFPEFNIILLSLQLHF